MATVFRHFICKECRRKERGQEAPAKCGGCGGKEFSVTEWYIRYWLDGRNREEKAGESYKAACDLLTVRKAEKIQGKMGIERELPRILMKEVIADFLAARARRYKDGGVVAKEQIDLTIKPEFGNRYLDDITPQSINRWLDKLRPENGRIKEYSAGSKNRYLGLLKSIFKYVRGNYDGMENYNPAKTVVIQKCRKARDRVLTRDEFWKLHAAAGTQELKDALELAVYTFLRRKNLFSMTWAHVDLKNGWINFPAEEMKNNYPHRVRISEPIREILERRRGIAGAFVILNPKTGKPYQPNTYMRTAFETACAVAKIEGFSWHGLRHTAATWFAEDFGNLAVLRRLLGHSTIEMVKQYEHLCEGSLARQAEGFVVGISNQRRGNTGEADIAPAAKPRRKRAAEC